MSIVFGTQTSAAEQNFIMVYLVGVSNNGCGTEKKFPRDYARRFWNPPFLNPRSAPASPVSNQIQSSSSHESNSNLLMKVD